MKIITLQASLVYNHSLYYGIDFMVGILATGSITYYKMNSTVKPFSLMGLSFYGIEGAILAKQYLTYLRCLSFYVSNYR